MTLILGLYDNNRAERRFDVAVEAGSEIPGICTVAVGVDLVAGEVEAVALRLS